MAEIKSKVSLGEKIGYSVGDTASNLFFQTFIYFITIFYTDVFGIPAKTVGIMFLITKIWDAVNDPMMGMISDRTKTRWGKFRPWILWSSVPFGVLFYLTFLTPDLAEGGKLVYAYATYMLMMTIYSVNNTPYSALSGVLTGDTKEKPIPNYRQVTNNRF